MTDEVADMLGPALWRAVCVKGERMPVPEFTLSILFSARMTIGEDLYAARVHIDPDGTLVRVLDVRWGPSSGLTGTRRWEMVWRDPGIPSI